MLDKLIRRIDGSEGFTMLELLIVMVIIAILVVIGLYAYGTVQDTARATASQAQAKAVFTNARAQKILNNDTYGTTESLAASLTGDDNITVTALTANNVNPPAGQTGVFVSGGDLTVRSLSEGGSAKVYCFTDTSGTIGTTCPA